MALDGTSYKIHQILYDVYPYAPPRNEFLGIHHTKRAYKKKRKTYPYLYAPRGMASPFRFQSTQEIEMFMRYEIGTRQVVRMS